MRWGVIGAGAFGRAMAQLLSTDHDVTLWGRHAADPDEAYPIAVKRTNDATTLASCDAHLIALPAQVLRDAMEPLAQYVMGKPLICLAKGLGYERLSFPYEALHAYSPAEHVGQLSGPAFAADLTKGLPTAMTLAMTGESAEKLQDALSTASLRVYLSNDLTGVALGGAYKNIIAIAAGIVIGSGQGESARAALISRGFAEMQDYAQAKGALPDTLVGLSGLGDLILTAGSEKSRNYRAGLALGRGDAMPPGTVEGVMSAYAVAQDAVALGLDLPITQALVALLDGRLDVSQAMAELWARPLRHE